MKFEDLVRVLKDEKKPTISRIAPDFYSAVQEYIRELEEADRKISRRHSEESIMIQYELKNALSTVDKIFNKRTRKIIKVASGRAFSKDHANIAHDIENMTTEEGHVYQQVLYAILSGKKNTIEPILGTLTENEPDIKPEIKTGSKTNIEPDIKPEIKTDSKTNIEPDIKPEIKTGSKTNTEPDIKPEIKPGSKTNTEPDIKPEIKTDSKTNIEPDIKPNITTPSQDTDEHMVPADDAGAKVSKAIPTDTGTTQGVPDQGPIAEKQDISGASAADNISGTEKSSLRETETQVTSTPLHKEEMSRNPEETGKKDLNKEYIVVRLLKDIPKFRGADGHNYRLGAQDVAVLPKVNANPLIKRKVAVQIEST